MAKYDQGGGCPCGLHLECNCGPADQKKVELEVDPLPEKISTFDFDDYDSLIRPLYIGLIIIGVIISPYIVIAVLLFFILESSYEIKTAIDNLKTIGYQG